ncbi:MAG: 50S ribosomal protein L4 [Eubacteriales bacterium]|jgi:large subunit ribosomal protein L4
MPKVTLYNMNAENIGEIELNDSIFGIEPNKVVMHQAVVNYLANQRQGTQSALTRAEVRGGGIKPWRQKGTGRARQGSIRAPQWTHGGVVFAPKPRDYSYSLNKKVKRLAVKSALSAKAAADEVIVLDQLTFDSIKTKNMVAVLKAFGLDSKALVVMSGVDENVIKSAANIPTVRTTIAANVNTYEVLNCDKMIITKDALTRLEEVYA